jgi:hypothetical protein
MYVIIWRQTNKIFSHTAIIQTTEFRAIIVGRCLTPINKDFCRMLPALLTPYLFDIPVPSGNNDVIYKLFPPRESLISDIQGGGGNIEKLFITVHVFSNYLLFYPLYLHARTRF